MKQKTDDVPRFDNPAREREWQVQENAKRRERLHLNPAGDDPKTQNYRLLASALRVAPPDGLPKDFARQMAAIVAAPGQGRVTSASLETILMATLAVVLLLSAVTATVIYGATWWPAFAALAPTSATAQWLLALVACLGLSWLAGAGSRLLTGPRSQR
ncbi:MAG: hypothetical protein ACREPY_15205 [Rhodanobacteraceae bacterium]